MIKFSHNRPDYILHPVAAAAGTFFTNPQYRITVIDPDEDDDDETGTLIVSLLQKRREGHPLLQLGYAIYKVNLFCNRVSSSTEYCISWFWLRGIRAVRNQGDSLHQLFFFTVSL